MDYFKVEALSILNSLHRTLTMADTRENAHGLMRDFHDYNFNRAVNKMNKANKKASKYDSGTKQHDYHSAVAEHHLGMANHHSQQMQTHEHKRDAASVGGYERREDDARLANQNSFANSMISKHAQFKQGVEAKAPKVPTPKTVEPKTAKVVKFPSPTPKIKTPKPVPNTLIKNALMPKAPAPTLIPKIRPPRVGGNNKVKAPVFKPPKPMKPAIMPKPQPAAKVTKPRVIPKVKPIIPAKPVRVPRIRATPR